MYCISNCENRDTGFLRSERYTTFKRKGGQFRSRFEFEGLGTWSFTLAAIQLQWYTLDCCASPAHKVVLTMFMAA